MTAGCVVSWQICNAEYFLSLFMLGYGVGGGGGLGTLNGSGFAYIMVMSQLGTQRKWGADNVLNRECILLI